MTSKFKHRTVGPELDRDEYERIDSHVLEGQTIGDLLVAASRTSLERLPHPGSPGKLFTSGPSRPDYAQRQLNQHVQLADGYEVRIGSEAAQRAWMKSTNGVFEHHGFPWLTAADIPTDETSTQRAYIDTELVRDAVIHQNAWRQGRSTLQGFLDTGLNYPSSTEEAIYIMQAETPSLADVQGITLPTGAPSIGDTSWHDLLVNDVNAANSNFSKIIFGVFTASQLRDLNPISYITSGVTTETPQLFNTSNSNEFLPLSADIVGDRIQHTPPPLRAPFVLATDASRRVFLFTAYLPTHLLTNLAARIKIWRLRVTAPRGRRGLRGPEGPPPNIDDLQFQINGNNLEWRLNSDDTWNDLGNVANLVHGDDGRDAYSSRIDGFSWSNGTFDQDSGNRFDNATTSTWHVAATDDADQRLLASLIKGTKISLHSADDQERRTFTLTADAAAHPGGDAGEYTLTGDEAGTETLDTNATYYMLFTQARPGSEGEAGTEYTAGDGLTLEGSRFSIGDGDVDGDMLARFAVSEQEKIASGVLIERHFDDAQVSKRAMRRNSVGTDQIEADAVTDGELAADSVGLSETKSEVADRLLPEFPAPGSRDNKAVVFDGDTLGYEVIDGGGASPSEIRAAVNAYLTANPPSVADNSLLPEKLQANLDAQKRAFRERIDSTHVGLETALPAVTNYNPGDVIFIIQDSTGANFVDLSAPSTVLTDAKAFDVIQLYLVRNVKTWARLGNLRSGSLLAQINSERLDELDDLTADMSVERREVWTLATGTQGGITTVETSEAALIAKMRAGTLDPSADLATKAWANNVNITEPNGRYLILRTDADESENDFGIRFNDENNYRHFYPYWFAVAQGDYRYHIWRTSSAPEDIRTTGGRVRLYHRSSEAHNTYHGELGGRALEQVETPSDLEISNRDQIIAVLNEGEFYGGNSTDIQGTYHLSVHTNTGAYTTTVRAEIALSGERVFNGAFSLARSQRSIQFAIGSTAAGNLANNGHLTVGTTLPLTLTLYAAGDVNLVTYRLDVPIVAKPATAPDVDQTARNAAAAAQRTASAALQRSGGTMTGKIILDGAPTSDLHAATKKYVDDNDVIAANSITEAQLAAAVRDKLNAMPDVIRPRGTFAVRTAYAIGDVVTYRNHLFYVAVAVPASNTSTPVDGATWVLLSADPTPTATTSRQGTVELATQSEMNAGSGDRIPDAAVAKTYIDAQAASVASPVIIVSNIASYDAAQNRFEDSSGNAVNVPNGSLVTLTQAVYDAAVADAGFTPNANAVFLTR